MRVFVHQYLWKNSQMVFDLLTNLEIMSSLLFLYFFGLGSQQILFQRRIQSPKKMISGDFLHLNNYYPIEDFCLYSCMPQLPA